MESMTVSDDGSSFKIARIKGRKAMSSMRSASSKSACAGKIDQASLQIVAEGSRMGAGRRFGAFQ